MIRKEAITIGVVEESLPSTNFKVKINERTVICYLSGKMRLHNIRISIGDRVEIILSFDGNRGRIVKRL